MAGRMILFAVICFLLYWAWAYYKARPKEECKEKEPDYSRGAATSASSNASKVDELIADFNKKIADIESKSVEEIQRSESILNFYKAELEKLNNLKNK